MTPDDAYWLAWVAMLGAVVTGTPLIAAAGDDERHVPVRVALLLPAFIGLAAAFLTWAVLWTR